MIGTRNSVAKVAADSPPITARPSGAFCSPPSPSPSDIGSMPMIMASAVISTGRSRVAPAASAAARASRASRSRGAARVPRAVSEPPMGGLGGPFAIPRGGPGVPGRLRVTNGGLGGPFEAPHVVIRERDHEDAVGGGDADAHDGAHQRGHAEGGVRHEQHPDDAG